MAKKTKKQKDKEFIEKLKSLQISTPGGKSQSYTCGDCGTKYTPVGSVHAPDGTPKGMLFNVQTPIQRDESGEQSIVE